MAGGQREAVDRDALPLLAFNPPNRRVAVRIGHAVLVGAIAGKPIPPGRFIREKSCYSRGRDARHRAPPAQIRT